MTSITKDINGTSVTFTVTEDRVVAFQVGGKYTWEERNKRDKLAISRWLLQTWNAILAQKTSSLYVCYPCTADGKGEYRRNVYEKLGFKYYDSLSHQGQIYQNIMVWGEYSEYDSLDKAESPYIELAESCDLPYRLAEGGGIEVFGDELLPPGWDRAISLPLIPLDRTLYASYGISGYVVELNYLVERSQRLWGYARAEALPCLYTQEGIRVTSDIIEHGWACAVDAQEDEGFDEMF